MKRLPLILLLLVAAAFVAGLLHFFSLRFEAGDIYPPYSSLRADPLGTKALYESLDRLVFVRRNFQDASKLGEGRDATLFLIGTDPRELRAQPDELRHLEQFVGEGGRLVIALYPQFQKPRPGLFDFEEKPKGTNSPSAKDGKKTKRPLRRAPFDENDLPPELRQTDLAKHWKFKLSYAVATTDERGVYEPIVAILKATAPLPESLAWHTAAFFEKPDPVWRAIYTRERDRPVVMERSFGGGSIVLVTDSYYFSNEALRSDRHAGLLAWLVGPSRRVIFDETHLGVSEDPGVATLARKYRLHGLVLALCVLAALFIWKNAASFLPPPEDEQARESGGPVAGKESAAGFVNLLRRNVSAGNALAACFAEWKKSCARTVSPAKLEEVQRVIDAETVQAARQRDPVGAYRKCCEVLARAGRKA